MSYYFCIVGTRDNPLYEADLAARSTASLGPSSFFSSSSSSSNSNNASSSNITSRGTSGFLRGSSPAPSASSASSFTSDTGASSDVTRSSTESSSNASTAPTDASGHHGSTGSSSGGSVFGFGTALGALAGGFTGLAGSSALTVGAAGNLRSGKKGPGGQGRGLGFGRYNDKDVLQMIAHSSLDAVEDVQFFNGAMYMKNVDRINEWTTSAFLIPGNVKFLILHEHKHDDGIRNFFIDVWESWVKITMNPFRDLNDPIRSATFDQKVRASARRYL